MLYNILFLKAEVVIRYVTAQNVLGQGTLNDKDFLYCSNRIKYDWPNR